METPVQLHLRDGQRWQAQGRARARGAAFIGDELLRAPGLAQRFERLAGCGEFGHELAQLNGFFAVICQPAEGKLLAAVDPTRSIPLFYGRGGQRLYLSDDAYWVRERVGDAPADPLIEAEFLCAGLVSGPDTLSPGVKQLQAGELLCAAAGQGGVDLETRRYSRVRHELREDVDEDMLAADLREALLAATKRLTKLAAGRLIAVPLSAGCDSRQIVLGLKEVGYGSVLAYSYGRPGNAESEESRRIAESLGFAWHFVPYSEALWRRWFHSPECVEYRHYADGLVSVTHLQDWPAVWQLKREGHLRPETIFAPGHTADCFHSLFGLDWPCYQDDRLVTAAVVGEILRNFYALQDPARREASLTKRFKERIEAALGGFARFESSAEAYEAWLAQESRAKFILNSVRGYEFWGYDWWLPLNDRALARFWRSTPMRYRARRRLAKRYVAEVHAELAGSAEQPVGAPGKLPLIKRVAALVRALGKASPVIRDLYHVARRRRQYNAHPLAWYGMVPRAVFEEAYHGRESINTYLALERLGRVSFADTP